MRNAYMPPYIIIGWTVYGLTFLVLLALTLSAAGDVLGHHLVWSVGAIAAWRYSWQALHFARSQAYQRVHFPALRRLADKAADAEESPPPLGVVVTSYRMSARENYATYAALFSEVIGYGAPAAIVASVTDDGDAALVHQIFRELAPPDHVQLIAQRQAGTGKRDAMAAALSALQRVHPGDGVVVLMDGDTVVTPGLFERCTPFFRLMPDLGALTTNNSAEVKGTQLAKDWYAMRFALRNMYMSSLSLSRRVLCLTGRFSMFRADIALSPDFVEAIRADTIRHWRLGTIRLLTGDDKSSWYHCLKNDWAMIYLPDTTVRCLEELPAGGFLRGAPRLMQRWFGNMLRSSDRALALGPRGMGLFTWWCLVDQRLNMWTSISGPVFALLFVLDGKPEAVLAYFTFILFSRFVQTVNVAVHGGRMTPWVPLLLLHQQFVGALIKISVMFHLDRQKWTRQNIGTQTGKRRLFSQDAYGTMLNAMSIVMFLSFLTALALVVTV